MVFLPTDISGLAAWYDAADAAGIIGVSPVTQWSDKSGNARHLTQAGSGPDYVAASSLMRFDGPSSADAAGDYLDLPPMAVRTVFALFKALNPQTAANRYHAVLGHDANTDTLYLDLPAGAPGSYGIRPKNGLNKVSLNGGAWISQGTANATAPVTFTLAGDIVACEYASDRTVLTYLGGAGSNGGPDWRPNWDMAELLIFSRVLTTAEKQDIEGYLAHKWGRTDLLPLGHPYKTIAPGSAGTLAVADAMHSHDASMAAISALTINEIADQRIFQRMGGAASIALTGGYGGAVPATVQARVLRDAAVVLDWTGLDDVSVDGGLWSGTLADVPEGGMYRVEARGLDNLGQTIAAAPGAHQWGVGDIYGLIGSSSAERWFTIGSGYGPDPLLKVFDGGWAAAGTTGAAAVTFGNQMIADSGVPTAIMDYGVGGSKLNQWMLVGAADYAAFKAGLMAAGSIRAVIAIVGMNDARAGEIASRAAHAAHWRTLIGNIRADAGNADLPVLIWGAQRSAEAGMDDQQFDWLHGAEHDVGEDANVTLALTTVDLPLAADNLHLSEAGMTAAAMRMARAAGAVLNASGLEWRGPELAQAVRVDDVQTDVMIGHHAGTDFTPASGITGFALSTDNFVTLKAISAAERHSANVIRLTHETTAGAAARVRYQYGAAPDVTGAVNDNGALPLPLGPGWQALDVLSGLVLTPDTVALAMTGLAPVLDAAAAYALMPDDCRHGCTDGPVILAPWRAAPSGRTLPVPGEWRGISISG